MSEPFDVIDQAARVLREPVATDPEAKRRLVDAFRAAPPPRRSAARRAWRWMARPRQIMISPLAGLAVAAAAALVIVLRPEPTAEIDGASDGAVASVSAPVAGAPASGSIPASLAGATTDAPSAGPRPVQFIFLAPTASTVSLVGDFNNWDPGATPLRAGGEPGVWVVEVPLAPGRHVYSFIVDGRQWYPDPLTARAPESEVDVPSSVVLVGGRAL